MFSGSKFFNFFKSKKTHHKATPKKKASSATFLCATLGACLAGCGTAAVSGWYVAKNYTVSNEYKDGWNMRIELDTRSDNPFYTADAGDNHYNSDQLYERAKATADTYSDYLISKGISTFEVLPEIDGDGSATSPYTAYLNCSVPNTMVYKYDDTKHEEAKIPLYQDLLYSSYLMNTRLTFVFNSDANMYDDADDTTVQTRFSTTSTTPGIGIMNNDSAFPIYSSSHDVSLSSDHKKANINLAQGWTHFFDDKDEGGIFGKAASGKDDYKGVGSPQMYIIRDMNSLISRMQFILQSYLFTKANLDFSNFNLGDVTDANSDAYKAANSFNYLTTDEQDWAKSVYADISDQNLGSSQWLNPIQNATSSPIGTDDSSFCNFPEANGCFSDGPYYDLSNIVGTDSSDSYEWNNAIYPSSGLKSLNVCNADEVATGDGAIADDPSNFFWAFINGSHSADHAGAASSNVFNELLYNASGGSTFTVPTWMKPYVLGVVDSTNYRNYFPAKLPNGKKNDKSKFMNIPFDSEFESKQVVSQLQNINNLPFKALDSMVKIGSSDVPSTAAHGSTPIIPMAFNKQQDNNGYCSNTTDAAGGNKIMNVDQQKFSKPLFFGFNPLLGSIIAIGAIILLIGIIVSILYRIPGLVAFSWLLALFGLSFLILILSGYAISFGMLCGLFVGLVISFISILGICERIKKASVIGKSVNYGVKKGIIKGILSTLDLHFIGIICAISFTYFGWLDLQPFGIALLLTTLLSVLFIGIIWVFTLLLAFSKRWSSEKFKLCFFRNKAEKAESAIGEINLEVERKFETNFSSCKLKHFSVFAPSSWYALKGWLSIAIALCIIIAGVFVITFVGIHGSYIFYGGTRIASSTALDNSTLNYFTNTLGLGSYKLVNQDGLFYYYFSKSLDMGQISGANTIYPDLNIQLYSGGGISSYVWATFWMILIASAFVAVYSFIRLHIITFIPVLISVAIVPLLLLALVSIFQISFDENVCVLVALVFAINSIMVINITGNIHNKWVKTQAFPIKDLKKVINTEIKNSLLYLIYIYGFLVASGLILVFLSSSSLTWLYVSMIIGVVVSAAVVMYVLPLILVYFISIRYAYLRSVSRNSENTKFSYDTVDEQSLSGINKFKRTSVTL